MYRTVRSQRSYLVERDLMLRGQGKLSRYSKRQFIWNEKTKKLKEIRHVSIPFKNTGSSLKFMSRHGIKPLTVISNGWTPPKGNDLKLEKLLIKNKQSQLSKKQRELVASL